MLAEACLTPSAFENGISGARLLANGGAFV
jgi:hypothetical protein